MKSLLVFTLLVSALAGFAQSPNKNTKTTVSTKDMLVSGTDPLGRSYHPIVGVLPGIGSQDIKPAITQLITGAANKGIANDNLLTYSTVVKNKFDDLRLVLPYLKSTEIKNGYYSESVPCEFIFRTELNRFRFFVHYDTVRVKPENPHSSIKKINATYHCFANLTFTITDVATSNVVTATSRQFYSNSQDARPTPPQTDSTITLQRLCDQVLEYTRYNFNTTFAGVGSIDSIADERKGKAKLVKVDYTKLLNGTGESSFQVFALGKVYESADLKFQHSEQVGSLLRPYEYSRVTRQMEVTRGERRIFEDFSAGKKLVCALNYLPPSVSLMALSQMIPTMVVDTFQVKVKGSPPLARVFQEKIAARISNYPQLVRIVNRNSYADIELEKAIQSKMKSINSVQAGIASGAEFILTADILDYGIRTENIYKVVEQQAPAVAAQPSTTPAQPANEKPSTPANPQQTKARAGRDVNPTNSRERAGSTQPAATKPAAEAPKPQPRVVRQSVFNGHKVLAGVKVEARLVSVKTGEIIWARTLNAAAEKEFPLNQPVRNRDIQQEIVLDMLADNFAQTNWAKLLPQLTKAWPILDVREADSKGLPKSLLVGGGKYAGMYEGLRMEVLEEVIEEVDGQQLKREVPIATLIAEEVFPETTAWVIKSGEEELQARLKSNKPVFCRAKF